MSTQEPPKYYGYNGGFANITKCMKCGNVGLYEDCHPANCCKHCGGDVVKIGGGRWVPPTYSGWLWWKKEVTPGHWVRS